jgi:YD repeat-containing protein
VLSADASGWAHACGEGGYIWMTLIGAPSAVMDDFGGGELVQGWTEVSTPGYVSANQSLGGMLTMGFRNLLNLFTVSVPAAEEAPVVSTPVMIDYQYDGLNRLTEANYSDGQYFHYEYDATGNRLSETTAAGTLVSTRPFGRAKGV